MKPFKILAIAPNDSLRFLMLEAVRDRENIILDAHTGDLEDGCAIAQQYAAGYDCIISRGGTAQQIREVSEKAVVEVEFSAYDLLQSINLARACAKKWAIVGFSSITKNARIISDLLQYNLDIFTIHTREEVDATLSQLRQLDYQMIVCDNVTDIYAKRQGIDSILINSGIESVEQAINEAVHICESNARIKERRDLYEMLLNNLEIDSYVYDGSGRCIYSSSNLTDASEIQSIISSQAALPEQERSAVIQKKIRGTIYNIEVKHVGFRDEVYTLYNIYHQKNKTTKKAGGIQYFTVNELNEHILSDFYLSPRLQLGKYERMEASGVYPPPAGNFWKTPYRTDGRIGLSAH